MYAGKAYSQVRCLLGKNVHFAKMPEVKLTVDDIVTPGHLKNPRGVLPTALFSAGAEASRGLTQNGLTQLKYKSLCNK